METGVLYHKKALLKDARIVHSNLRGDPPSIRFLDLFPLFSGSATSTSQPLRHTMAATILLTARDTREHYVCIT